MVLQCLGDLGPAGQCGNNRVREEERGHRTRLPMALSPSSRPGLAEKGLFQGLGAEECMQCDFFGMVLSSRYMMNGNKRRQKDMGD